MRKIMIIGLLGIIPLSCVPTLPSGNSSVPIKSSEQPSAVSSMSSRPVNSNNTAANSALASQNVINTASSTPSATVASSGSNAVSTTTTVSTTTASVLPNPPYSASPSYIPTPSPTAAGFCIDKSRESNTTSIIPGSIDIIYQNSYNMRVDKVNKRVTSSDANAAAQINAILVKYNIQQVFDFVSSNAPASGSSSASQGGCETPDSASIHGYRFPDNADTIQIAKELNAFSFVRTAYPTVAATNGFKEIATVNGYIYDINGTPLSNVTLTGKFTRPDYSFIKEEKSQEDGRYYLNNIPIQPYGEVKAEITASKDGYKSKTRIVTIKSNLTDSFINTFNFGGTKVEEKPYALEKL